MTKYDIDMRTRIARIGRPHIGGEFLDICADGYNSFSIRRFKWINSQNEAPRKLGDINLPSETMVYDLLGAIEGVIEYVGNSTDCGPDLDFHGLDGGGPSLRERFSKLSKLE